MIALHVLSVIFGAVLALAILGSALKTVVLPQEGFPRLAQAVFATVHRLLVHRSRSRERAIALRSLYAPVALVSLPLVWMLSMVVAFTFIFWGTGSMTWQRSFEISGSSLTTLGFAEPSGTARIWLAFIEATIGLGLVALLISYLPTIYGAYNGREKGIIRLRPISGAPPAVVTLLLNLQRVGALDNVEFWRNQSEWILDIEQTHTAFPILTYFPETHQDHSWVATIGTMLDAAALVLSSSETEADASFEDIEKGPMMVLVYGMPGFVRVAARRIHPDRRADGDRGGHQSLLRAGTTHHDHPGRVRRGHGGPGARHRRRTRPHGGCVAPLRLDPVELRARRTVVGGAHVRVPGPVDDRPCRQGRPAAVPAAPGHRGGLVGERDGTR